MFISLKASLLILGIVSAISIDNELRVIKIDCYERIAIGQRLNASNVYKVYKYNTVGDCKKVCSEENAACKAFSFGISTKGNGTCELSPTTIKETGDFKPVGTITDVDFDLFIKKSGCTVVTEKYPHRRRPIEDDFTSPNTLGNVQDGVRLHNTAHNNGVQNVQTVVSVASGPQTVLNPIHGIIVSSDRNKNNIFDDANDWYKGIHEIYPQPLDPYNYSDDGNSYNLRYDKPSSIPYTDINRYDNDFNFNRYGDKTSTPLYDPKSEYRRYPTPDKYGSVIPHPDYYYERPTHQDYPYPFQKPSNTPDTVGYQYNRPYKPFGEQDNFSTKPVSLSLIYEIESFDKPISNKTPPKKSSFISNTKKPIVTHSTGYNGEQITSIITEIKDACFRRVLAGKRIARGFVRRALNCETVEECQKECGDEKLFSCEGFNYRLDPSGRGKGDCELLSIPLSRIDVYRDSYADQDYDYYEKDRNAVSANCRQRPPYRPYKGNGNYQGYRYGVRDHSSYDSSDRWSDRRHEYGGRRPSVTYHGSLDYGQNDRWRDDDYHRKPVRPEIDRRYDYGSYDTNRRRGDNSYLPRERPHDYDRQPVERYPQNYYKYPKPYSWGTESHRYGETNRHHNTQFKNYYLPPRNDDASNTLDWGLYDKFKNNYSHWGIQKYGGSYGPKEGYLPPEPDLEPPRAGSYLPDPKPYDGDNGILTVPSSSLLPVEHRRPSYINIQDDCSLRSVTGFKLSKRIVKKYFAVPNIYECEMLCFKENDFTCSSYAFRYTVTVTEPTHNCYLSNLDYKELDHYTDLEPDRDFDVYTMNNRNRCDQPQIGRKENSDCFWRVRSGERLHHNIVRDSLMAKSIVDCQLECLASKKFTCRAFSYRYGPSIIGGSIDNCQLTDWPYYELDPLNHFIPEPGFEIYERGSFGHGCETGHFGIRGHINSHRNQVKTNQLCYIGFASPARLLPQATKKSVRVFSESECKEECSRARLETLFQCMSFSFWSKSPGNVPNCDLSDIYQRDLLPKMDYVYDPNALLFAWDNYNPDCLALANDPLHTNRISSGPTDPDYFLQALDTWRVYSVNGWPCRRGALCKENARAGFWFCEIEGGENGAWDYCCRPDHQCGASNGYPYLWCYVGPDRTQWRKCNDRYYPYLHDRLNDEKYYLPVQPTKPWRPSLFRPDRRPGQAPLPPPKPSLDQYEMIFDEEFLEPPKPGGFGQPRHWPVSYLHKVMPPNDTNSRSMRLESEDTKFSAIQNLISVIKNNDLKNLEYHITTEPNKKDDILFVKIPLPSNFTFENNDALDNKTVIDLEPITVEDENQFNMRRYQKSLPTFVTTERENNFNEKSSQKIPSIEWEDTTEKLSTQKVLFTDEQFRPNPVYRRGFVVRTNITTHGKHS